MPARSVITARQERLGAELRKLRERAGLSGREAARTLGIAESKLSATEVARVGVSAERVRHWASRYACADAALVDALAAMATERGRGWWEEYRGRVPSGYLDVAELEHHSLELRTFQSVLIPALLQTEEQIRAIFTSTVPKLSPEEIDVRTRFRLRRQGVLGGIGYLAVVHEAALRIRAADEKVARAQLLHILEQSERQQVTVRVVPFDVDGFAGIDTPLVYARGPVPQLDTVLADTPHGGALLDAEAQLNRYRAILGAIEEVALGVVESRDFIHRLAQQM
ncbi:MULTISPECIES: Scr1 family TA system antitoxin-like transcriptional regulator [unclassified Streptomyces]|uniref:Scr1 family TA system antitoxin-like transcriptional regulator n=1 Tax=unclassified Streptomyces TaxID=2593676 RepID=UPI002366808A|nr:MULTISPECIES: Scr1 family TA system antitoxin-like transcriptional regulator [unclassified Streptomyces]MDF3142951.1 Scr1 family TA system antitoxin-like transcriptional regulator [Streptomyces sp. T21Q-yed]WDF40007.1 Scr1 family TA system antitoxin-like transcriptional regulator [Streptomyces sp. T12]